MTLTGFQHTKDNLKLKDKLTNLSELDRATESRRSRRSKSVRSSDLRNPDSASETSSHAGAFGINKADAPPMGVEIENADLEEMSAQDMEHQENQACACERPRERDPANLNPKNFAFLPPCYTAQIRPAGKFVNKSSDIKNVFSIA